MCNIAGYIGERRAAPILLEMCRRQEIYDGGGGVGIATVHNGRMYMRKVEGTVDDLIRLTDARELPGTVGIIHTRPSGKPVDFIHPHTSEGGRLAMVQNGDLFLDKYHPLRSENAERARARGYTYLAGMSGNSAYPHLADGTNVPIAEAAAHLVAMHREEGLGYSEALARAGEEEYSQIVSVMLTANDPGAIRVLRITSAMNALVGDGETMIATCTYAFDEGERERAFMLPELAVCEVGRSGVTVTEHRVRTEGVDVPTEQTYSRARELVEDFLRASSTSRDKYFTDIELLLRDHKAELFPGGYTYTQHARVAYDIVSALDREGKIKSEVRANPEGTRRLRYMWID